MDLDRIKALMEGKIVFDDDIDDDLKELQKELGMDYTKTDKEYNLEEELTSKYISKKTINKKDNKKEKHNNDLDPELEELEKEGLDDIEISDEENESNKVTKTMNKDLIQSILQSSKMIIKDNKKKENEVEKKNEKVKDDIYFENTENKYHNIKTMKCISVLENEIKVCDEIIKFKKDNKYDDEDIWESKKVLVETNFRTMKNFVEEGAIGFDEYKKVITDELKYDEKLFNIINNDKSLKEIEIPELKNRINKRIELIKVEIKQLEESQNKEEEEEEEDLNVPKDNKLNNKLLKIVKDKYNEYSKAKEYFIKNNLEDQLNETNNILKKLEKAQKNIEELYSQRVKENSLPGEITPIFINGCSTNERISKFKEILKEMIIQKNNINKDINEINTKMKNLKAIELELVESEFKKEINSKKEKVTLYEKLINIIKQCLKDKWIPVPLYQKEKKIEKIETFNDLVEKNVLNIHIGKIEEIKESHLMLEIHLDIGKGYSDIVNQNKNKSFDYNIDWIIEKEFRDIYKYDLGILIKQKGEKISKVIGSCTIKLSNLKSKCIIYGNYPIELVKKNDKSKPKIQVKISTRVPCVDKIYLEKKIPIYVIKKIYPSFKGEVIKIDFDLNFDSVGDNLISQKKTNKNQNDSSEKKIDNINQNKNPNPQNKKTDNTNQNISQNVKIDINQFKKEELVDPDIIDNLNSMEVLKNKKTFYEEKAKKIEGRTPKELREKINKIVVKINFLQNQLGNQIQPSAYLNILENQLIHDKSLYQYFIQTKNNNNASLVKTRIEILEKEIQELKKFINQK